jgi:membrane dipeptidase
MEEFIVKIFLSLLALSIIAIPLTSSTDQAEVSAAARALAHDSMIVDTHIDVPMRVMTNWVDVGKETDGGDFDYERGRRGGLDIPFMSIYTPATAEEEGKSYALANQLIDSVEAMVGRAPGKFALVRSVQDAEKAMQRGLMGLAMGMENGSPIDGKLENLQFFRDRGISYITLAHSLSNHISDSSFDEKRQWNGLSPFGKEVVAEMNRLGIMIDISHVSDEAFWQVLELSAAPVIASHSSARQFTPGFERNMSDEMIVALARAGGVMQINFGSSFLTRKSRDWYDQMKEARKAFLEENGFDLHGSEVKSFFRSYRAEHPFPFATLDDLMAHFQHVIELVGIEHVGIGSDFDGVGDSLPEGMKDVSFYPQLVERLLKLEYSAQDIKAVLGGNLMRVWREVENQAVTQASKNTGP